MVPVNLFPLSQFPFLLVGLSPLIFQEQNSLFTLFLNKQNLYLITNAKNITYVVTLVNACLVDFGFLRFLSHMRVVNW